LHGSRCCKRTIALRGRKKIHVGFENLGNSPLSPTILGCELEFLGIIFG